MKAPSEDIKDIMEGSASGLTLTFATDLFIGHMPPSPDKCVTIYDTSGYPAELDYTYQRPTFQIKVRGNKGGYRAAHELAQAIRDLLHGTHNENVNGARYILIAIESDVGSIGPDEQERPQFTVNFRAHRTEA